ncbi:unnamed protein product [Callosobruchus maculatus]|uniref:Phosphatidylethanolamine-binding protein n=1 Tax=Callosobruchus maculatus TaxID=64391 RepID=A0A653C1Q1_CALMS|nr:unnamed protein product [Callosobruchus maculatus]
MNYSFLVVFLSAVISACLCADDVKQAFTKHQIKPDVLADAPEKSIEVKYKNGKEVKLGNELTPTEVKDKPDVKYEGEAGAYYTLIMTDPDAPSRKNPTRREWHHWLVVNIPGTNVNGGETISEYVGSAPPKGSGLHRYVFVLFKQPGKVKFEEPKHSATDGNRANFNTKNFAKKYNLGKPIAGNFFQAQWDEYVPQAHKKLGF